MATVFVEGSLNERRVEVAVVVLTAPFTVNSKKEISPALEDHASVAVVVAIRQVLVARDWLHSLIVKVRSGVVESMKTVRLVPEEIFPAASFAKNWMVVVPCGRESMISDQLLF